MAILKVIQNSYETLNDVSDLINYVLNPNKMENNIWESSCLYLYGNPLYTANEIAEINAYYGKTQGSIVKHFIVSYPYLEGPCTPQRAEFTVKQMLNIDLFGFPYIYALHENTIHLHFHIILGTVNIYSGMKYPEKRESIYSMVETLSQYSTFIDSDGKRKHINYTIIYGEKE